MRTLFKTIFLFAITAPAWSSTADSDELKRLLDEFLAGATIGSVETHERFWSEDLVYTSSDGTRTGKAEIVARMRASEPSRDAAPAVVYSAEDVDVRVYGATAIVAFRLVGTDQGEDGIRSEYFNTGTFIKRASEWRAVAWQATRIPAAE